MCVKRDADTSFLTGMQNCEGANARGYLLSYIYQTAVPRSQTLYRCNVWGVGHFASTDSTCEQGNLRRRVVTEGPLGYVY